MVVFKIKMIDGWGGLNFGRGWVRVRCNLWYRNSNKNGNIISYVI